MNTPQFNAILKLESRERFNHFVSKVAGCGELWAAKNDEGWLVPLAPEGFEYLPIWPHPEYAQEMTDIMFPGHSATRIDLDDFLRIGILEGHHVAGEAERVE